jgi:ABC-type phosphate transport system permease subunit
MGDWSPKTPAGTIGLVVMLILAVVISLIALPIRLPLWLLTRKRHDRFEFIWWF